MYGALTVLGVLSAAGADLSVPVAASTRPEVCLPERRSELWDRARLHPLEQFCQELASGHVVLATQPERALETARALAKAWPGRPEPWALTARAHAGLGAHEDAWAAWGEARARGYDFRAPLALRDYAVSASLTGRVEPALAAYRNLIALAAAWPDSLQRQAVYVEAALAAVRAGASPLEASSSLTQARPTSTSVALRAIIAGVSALVAELNGRSLPRSDVLDSGEIWHFVAQLERGILPAFWPRVPSYELAGAASLLVEPYSADEAAALWRLYRTGLGASGASAELERRAAERAKRLDERARSAR